MPNKQIKTLAKRIVENSAYDADTESLFFSNPGISFEVLRALAKKHNFTIGQTQSGQFISIPTSFKHTSEMFELYDDFLNTYTLFSRNYDTLKTAYATFDAMDENISEVSLILDTYAAEVLSAGFIENPLNIKISNKNAQTFIEKVLYKNKIYQRLPNIVRSIAKYGNYGFLLSYPYLDKWMTDKDVADFRKIDVLEDLLISCVNPKYFKVNTDEYNNPINYEVETNLGYVNSVSSTAKVDKKIWQPWQFVHAVLYDELTEPYGKSVLWSMRSAFDQLTTLEGLLGISRASKIQRLVFYVPMPNGIAVSDSYAYMNEWRAQYLNSIFSDTNAPKAGRKFPGAMSILTLPVAYDGKKVDFEKIESNIDLSSTEDVEYFLDKILRNSSLPKGYLVGEDVITTAQTLEAQDLKLKRALLPLKRATLNAMMCLIENVLTHAGYDVSKLDIEVSLNEPIQIPADVISKYNDICELMKSFMELNGNMTNINKFQFLIKMGLPSDIAQLVCSNTSVNMLSSAEELAKFLNRQKIHTASVMPDISETEETAGPVPSMGESVSMTLSNKEFNSTNYNQYKLLREVYEDTQHKDNFTLVEARKIYTQKEILIG